MTRLAAVLVALSLALPARADEVVCALDDMPCVLSAEVHAVTKERDDARALGDRLTRELEACRATQGACPALPPPEAYPWRDVVTAGAVGVAVGVVAWAVVSLALSR